jgi:hypothetical protein
MANVKEARFVHPSEFGMQFPINTPQELRSIVRAINGGMARSGQPAQPAPGDRKPIYKVVK